MSAEGGTGAEQGPNPLASEQRREEAGSPSVQQAEAEATGEAQTGEAVGGYQPSDDEKYDT